GRERRGRGRMLQHAPLDELPLPREDRLLGRDARAERPVLLLDAEEPRDERADVRRDPEEELGLAPGLEALAARGAVRLERVGERGVGRPEPAEEGRIERFEPA